MSIHETQRAVEFANTMNATQLSTDGKLVLYVFNTRKAFARKETFYRAKDPTGILTLGCDDGSYERAIDECILAGVLKRNKAGAVSMADAFDYWKKKKRA